MDYITLPRNTAKLCKVASAAPTERRSCAGTVLVVREGQDIRLDVADGHQALRLTWSDGQTFEHETFSVLLTLEELTRASKAFTKGWRITLNHDGTLSGRLPGSDEARVTLPRIAGAWDVSDFPDLSRVLKPTTEPGEAANVAGFGTPLLTVYEALATLAPWKKGGSQGVELTLNGPQNAARVRATYKYVEGIESPVDVVGVVMPVRL